MPTNGSAGGREPESERPSSRSPDRSAGIGRWLALPGQIARTAAAIDRWLQKRKQIRDLRELTDEQLNDIGLSRKDVHQASAGSFWD